VRRATSYEQAREWIAVWTLLQRLGTPSVLLVLASGMYLGITMQAWAFGWAKLAMPTLFVVAAAGGIVGRRRARLRGAVASGAGPLPGELQAQLRQPLLLASWRLRFSLLAGLLFEMTVKPDLAGAALVTGGMALFGVIWSLPLWRREPALQAAPSSAK
jgi:hypothetical protein